MTQDFDQQLRDLLAFVIGLPLYLWYRGFTRRVEVRSRLKALNAT